jgi:hypothetical protein
MKNNHRSRNIRIAVAVAVLVVIVAISIFAFNTAGGKRTLKSWSSSISNGIEREIIVYDAVGNELYRQQGKFDIDYESERILYDDEKGLRHTIYFKDGIIIVNEISKDSDTE